MQKTHQGRGKKKTNAVSVSAYIKKTYEARTQEIIP